MSFGAAPGGGGGMDEYQRLMAERNAAAKKKRMLFGLVAIVAVGGIGYFVMTNRKKNQEAQKVLDAGGRFAERGLGNHDAAKIALEEARTAP